MSYTRARLAPQNNNHYSPSTHIISKDSKYQLINTVEINAGNALIVTYIIV